MRFDLFTRGAIILAAACPAAGEILDPPDVKVVPFITDISRGVDIIPIPESPGRYFIGEQRVGNTSTARIRIHDRASGESTTFLTVSPISTMGPQGLLDIAVHPDYANNGYVFINYTDFAGTSRIERYQRSAADPDVADPASRTTVIVIPQIAPTHNAAWLEFGPDGYLYLGTGDGGNGGDPANNAQSIDNGKLLGKLLRLDVDGDDFPESTRNYAIPPGNPFVGIGDGEIWAYGLRHPWRGAFDPLTNDMYFGDVGDASWEEINFQPSTSTGGENYGWHCREGGSASTPDDCPPGTNFRGPVHIYGHTLVPPVRCAIIGGKVYRGNAIPELHGFFLYADYCSHEILAARWDGKKTDIIELTEVLAGCDIELEQITGFSVDEEGEILILARGPGIAYKLIPVCRGDVDSDGSIDFKDLNLVLEYWGTNDPNGDADNDCDVDFADLNLVLERWGSSCP